MLHHHIGPPTKSFHWATSACQIFANPMHSFEDMTIWFFCRFGLKCLFTPQKFWFWGSEPLNVIDHHRDPKNAHPWLEPHLHSNFGTDRSTGATCARDKGIIKKKKGKERNLQWQTGCSPRPATLTQRYVVLHVRWSLGGSYKFQVSSKSVEQFSRCGGSKFTISCT